MNDQAHGDGRIEYVDGNCYDGQWQYEMCTGIGTYYGSDGSVYKGQWYENYKHGAAEEETYSDGSRYEGQFDWGQKHGIG